MNSEKQLTLCRARGTDPYENLALEEYLLFHVKAGECVLYLWQNRNTVVIGRNQNAWKECRVSLLEEENGYLARRLSGGGAVYHDLGNLNFTFLVRKEDYNLKKQLEVIARAARSFGIEAEVSGRNDVLAQGRKFSGNAFYESGDFAYHHGTILVDVDTDRMSRYLTVSKEKLKSHSVDSVRSRVGNLKEFCPQLTVETMETAMQVSFAEVYGQTPQIRELTAEDRAFVERLKEKYASWDFRFGRAISFTNEAEKRFSWGSVQIQWEVFKGSIRDIKIYSDSLDVSVGQAAELLKDCPYERRAIEERLAQAGQLSKDIQNDLAGLLEP